MRPMSTGTSTATAVDLDIEPGDQLQGRDGKWRTVVTVTDARPGRVWVL